MIAPNIFKCRNDWNVKSFQCRKYCTTLNDILTTVISKTGIKKDLIKSDTRVREIVEARYFYYKRAKKCTHSTLESIGRLVNRDHAGVLHGIRMVDECKEINDRYNELFTR